MRIKLHCVGTRNFALTIKKVATTFAGNSADTRGSKAKQNNLIRRDTAAPAVGVGVSGDNMSATNTPQTTKTITNANPRRDIETIRGLKHSTTTRAAASRISVVAVMNRLPDCDTQRLRGLCWQARAGDCIGVNSDF
jgi:hypothetical protein